MRNFLFSLFLIILSTFYSYSQTGSSCSNPHIIVSIPFSLNGLSTAGMYNTYISSPCGNNYISGNDYVFKITPLAAINIKITLSNTTLYGVGIFVFDKCPDDTLAHCVQSAESENGNPEIQSAYLLKDSTYYIVVSTYNFFNLNPITPFDINITESLAQDAAILYINRPITTCGLTSYEGININLRNEGFEPISNFDISYRVNDGPIFTEHYFDTIAPYSGLYYSLLAYPLDLSTIGATYKIQCFTQLSNDGNHINDTATVNITNSIVINTFPYQEDYESGSGGWVSGWNYYKYPFISWELGTPADTALHQAASGTQAWKTNLTGFYHESEFSYIQSPCFDFSSLQHPWIQFDIWYELNSLDLVTFEASIDGGANWTVIGSSNEGSNWYNTPLGISTVGWQGFSGNWLTAKHALNGLGGQNKVQLRLVLSAGHSGVNEGVAFDNVKIFEAPAKNLGIVAIASPTDNCSLSNSENIRVKIANFGTQPQANFNVAFSLNNNVFISENFTDSIFPNDTILYNFSHAADFSNPGLYQIFCKTQLIGDQDFTNDLFTCNIINYQSQSEFPFYQDFETHSGDWYSSGINSSWEYGTPTDSVINHAASGSNAWKTNINGFCNAGEKSYLTGSCFDLSTLQNPYVKMNIWYETQNLGTMFEYSIDSGVNWLNLGASTDSDWYNQGYNWLGHTGNWIFAKHSLFSLNENNHIQFRFVFQSLTRSSGFAFDDFAICDAPLAGFKISENWPNVKFTCTSVNANFFHWDFGDGDTSNMENPAHHFANDTNLVTLIVGNQCNTDTITKIIYNCEPQALFTDSIKGNQIYFINSSIAADSVLWLFGDGDSSTFSNPVHTFQKDTNIVTLIVKNSCGIDSVTKIIIKTEIEEITFNPVKIFPNPAKKEFYIELPYQNILTDISITNFQGIESKKNQILSNTCTIDISDLTEGIYLLKIQSNKFHLTKKIIIQ